MGDNFTRNNRDGGDYGGGLGALAGGGIAGRHPSIPNWLETLLDPNRRWRLPSGAVVLSPKNNVYGLWRRLWTSSSCGGLKQKSSPAETP